jgi:F-type H+-transporting ATPase subunit a
MPEHSSWLTLVLSHLKGTLSQNAHNLGASVIGHVEPTWQSFEPIVAAFLIVTLIIGLSLLVRGRLTSEAGIIPEDKLTAATFLEAFLEYFYDLAKSVMDADRAKKYFPIIATSALFVFTSNIMALVPGAPVATSNLNITLGSALVVFLAFNFYGIKENGVGYIKHLMGPKWYLAPLIFPVEVVSLCVRPVTLAVRLMLNIAVDHLILSIFLGLFAVLVPIPVMILGVLVVLVQTLVFTLLTCIYIGLATEHEHEHEAHH